MYRKTAGAPKGDVKVAVDAVFLDREKARLKKEKDSDQIFEGQKTVFTSTKNSCLPKKPRRFCYSICLTFLFIIAILYNLDANFCNTKANLQLLHIPKTGGTTITREGYKRGYLWGSVHWVVCKYSPFHWYKMKRCLDADTIENNRPHHMAPRDHKCKDYFGNTFCSVRNPYTRMLSEYIYRTEEGKPYWCTPRYMNRALQKWFRIYRHTKRSVHSWHFVPQSEFVWNKEGLKTCTHILRYENLQEDFNSLMGRSNVNVRIGDDNTGQSFIYSFVADQIERYMGKELKREGGKYNVRKRCPNLKVSDFDEKTLQLIKEVYKDDFEKFGYSTELP